MNHRDGILATTNIKHRITPFDPKKVRNLKRRYHDDQRELHKHDTLHALRRAMPYPAFSIDEDSTMRRTDFSYARTTQYRRMANGTDRKTERRRARRAEKAA